MYRIFRSNDKGTSRQYWFTASMLAISKDTVRRRIESLTEWGELTVTQNCVTVQMQNNSGAISDLTLYDLHAFNKLAMDLRTPAAREIKSKFSDVLVEKVLCRIDVIPYFIINIFKESHRKKKFLKKFVI